MRAVRCQVCGAKALTAAAKCPKCGHLFEVRDGFGELLPLAYCSSCDSYYPEHLGECRWCGTKPERAPIGPYIWRGAAAVGFAAMIIGAVLMNHKAAKKTAEIRLQALPESRAAAIAADTQVTQPVAAPADTSARFAASAPTDSPAQKTYASAGSIARDSAPAPVVSAPEERESEAAPTPAPVTTHDEMPRVAATRPLASAVKKATKAAATTTRKSTTRWVTSVSRQWVVVRAGASPSSRAVASIGPNTRVQLGESRGDWSRVRAKGLSGWVEHRAFFAVLASARRPRSLAVH
jgi:SH3 domain-containing protein